MLPLQPEKFGYAPQAFKAQWLLYNNNFISVFPSEYMLLPTLFI